MEGVAKIICKNKMAQTSFLRFSLPPSTLFKLPGLPSPPSLPFPEAWLQFPFFRIPHSIYNGSMDYACSIVIAILYLVVSSLWSEVNRHRRGKPWALSQTTAFRRGVILHNLSLTIYSAWALRETIYAIRAIWPDNNQVDDALYAIRVADILCFADHFSTTEMYRSRILFVAWTFYLSKIYELLDSAILLIKGRQPSTLHKYHHAIVIFCAWTAVRFACPPAIVALLFNAAVHTVMVGQSLFPFPPPPHMPL